MKPEKGMRDLWLATVATILAIAASLTLAAAALGSRVGLWHFRTGFALLKYGAWAGLAAALISVAAACVCFKKREALGLVIALAGIAVGTATFAIPLKLKLAAQRLPRIHDITTDTANPPPFVAVLPSRGSTSNPVEYGGAGVAAKQQQAYPDLKTLVLDIPAPQAFDRALDAARHMGWKIVAAVPGEGRIEATDTTFWFGFTDDIVIRIMSAGSRSLLDIRSLSRAGVSDVGTNARRIRAYLEKISGHP